jgi:hypothetical protein
VPGGHTSQSARGRNRDSLATRYTNRLQELVISWMSPALVLLHNSAICFVGAIFFKAIDWLELNRRVAIILKCAIIAASVAAIANQLLPGEVLTAIGMGR